MVPPSSGDRTFLTAAYAACTRRARQHYENFPVASLLLPKRMRPHVAAVYAFARVADDLADEGDRPASERQHLLDGWQQRLHEVAETTRPEVPGPVSSLEGKGANRDETAGDEELLLLALGNTIRECRLPVALLDDLISAFRQDTITTRYATYDDLMDYCRRSANPVGRLVLRIGGYEDERADAASDCVCTALQLTNFWQDLERDWRRGRLYVPLDELHAAGASERDLDRGRLTPAWQHVLTAMGRRTRDLFERGREVTDRVGGRLAIELRVTWLGGRRILERLEHQRFDVFGRRPALGVLDVPLLLWRAAAWRPSVPLAVADRAAGQLR